MTPLGRYVFETIVTLLLVTGLAVLVLMMARRSGMGRALGPLSLAGRLVLDPRRAIYLVRVGETLYVVGASEAGLTKLGELARDAVNEAELGASAPPSFKELLTRFGVRPPPRASAPGANAADQPRKEGDDAV
ncbi:MAG TPA: flagellar biosynthetic protein FliO [Polyangiaceae bacterium]|nr:flagellar biosynthetic protein FliO [Polyangiaceae bacterium]